ncbi:hypothetical protein E2542_SST21810 [Spatholobus suberectus]|nr:hypothetical protein E2542_SST21810 [Spatholobus suberectus]
MLLNSSLCQRSILASASAHSMLLRHTSAFFFVLCPSALLNVCPNEPCLPACKVFDEIPVRDVPAWTALLIA